MRYLARLTMYLPLFFLLTQKRTGREVVSDFGLAQKKHIAENHNKINKNKRTK